LKPAKFVAEEISLARWPPLVLNLA